MHNNFILFHFVMLAMLYYADTYLSIAKLYVFHEYNNETPLTTYRTLFIQLVRTTAQLRLID